MARTASRSGNDNDVAAEIKAISTVYSALNSLLPAARQRVIQYVVSALAIETPVQASSAVGETEEANAPPRVQNEDGAQKESTEGLDGVSPVAAKWMRRNGLSATNLEGIYTLGINDIDLIAEEVPGGTKNKRMRSVFLLKGIAAFLSSGAARFSHEQVRETCQHYDAWDQNNFGRYFAAISSEVSGTKESGYQLSTRGMGAAAQLIKEMKPNQNEP